MKVDLFHLTNEKKLKRILEEGKIKPTKKITYLDSKYFEELGKNFSFFIYPGDIDKWENFWGYCDKLLYHISNNSSEDIYMIKIVSEDDNFFVVDRFYQFLNENYRQKGWFDKELYPLSIIPLSDYLLDNDIRELYLLPEVISSAEIDLKKVKHKIIKL